MKKIITIVGVGALGSHVLQLLRNADATFRLIDFDRVEQKNTMSQFHGKPSVGKLKVQSLGQTMNMFFGIKAELFTTKLQENNSSELLGLSSLILDCLDNGAARRVVQNYARNNKIPCLHGALAADGSFGRVVWDENFVIDNESSVGTATCEDGAHLPFIAITAAYFARSAQVFLADGKRIGFQINPVGAIVT